MEDDDWNITPLLEEFSRAFLQKKRIQRNRKKKATAHVRSHLNVIHRTSKTGIENRKKLNKVFHDKLNQIVNGWKDDLNKLRANAELLQSQANQLCPQKNDTSKEKRNFGKLNKHFYNSVTTVEKLHLQQIQTIQKIQHRSLKKLSQKYMEDIQKQELERLKACMKCVLLCC